MNRFRTLAASVSIFALAAHPVFASDNAVPFTMDSFGNVNMGMGSGKVQIGRFNFGSFFPNSQIVNVDLFGAKGDGIFDDSAAIALASQSLGNSGGTVRLTCGKRYYIAKNVYLGAGGAGQPTAPGVTLEGCNQNPDDPGIFSGQVGAMQTYGGIVRAAGATLFVGRNGGIRHLAIDQVGITTGMDTSAAFSGTAISALPNGLSQTIDIEDVSILGATTCFDSTSGAGRMKMHNVIGDCQGPAFIFGTSADSSEIGYVHPFPNATAAFGGYTVTNVTGNGTTTTLTFTGGTTYPSVGDYIYVTGGSSALAQQPFTIGFAVTASAPGSATFNSAYNGSSNAAGMIMTDYTKQNLRTTGAGILILGQNDDSRFDNIFDFGHPIGLDDECNGHGIHHIGRFWGDNNSQVGAKFNSCQQVHANSIHAAGIGGKGLQVIASNFSLDDFKSTSFNAICGEFDSGNIQVTNANISNCTQFGIFPGGGVTLAMSSLMAYNSPVTIAPPDPAEQVRIDSVFTDKGAGLGNIYLNRTQSVLGVQNATILLPTTGVPGNGQCEEYYVSSTTPVSTLSGAWGGRCVRIIETSTGTIQSGGDVALAAGATFGGTAGSVIEFSWDNLTNTNNQQGGFYREHWRRVGP